MNNKIPLIAVCGPTASGKTALSVELAKRFDGEIVSSDSMQIYKKMDIGTAKPTIEEMQGIPHHMMSVVDIDCNFSVSDYCHKAHHIIEDIHRRGKLPILVGGTGLYVDSLLNDIDFSKGCHSEDIREKYIKLLDDEGASALHNRLAILDIEAAESIHPNNTKRVIRALEHIDLTGEKFSVYKKAASSQESRYNSLVIFIDMDRQKLYERIDKRVDIMMEEGLFQESKEIYDFGYNRSLTAMCAIGYKELFDHFDGICGIDEAVENIKRNSRRYAKRQLTWFRRSENLHRISAEGDLVCQATEVIHEWLKEWK